MTFQLAYARRPLARKPLRAGLTPLGADQFEGYASLFHVRDGAGDSVAPGAFAASLRERGPGQVRMLYQHLRQPRAGDLAIVAAALLRGGGHDMCPAEVLRLECDLGALMRSVTQAFEHAGLQSGAVQGADAGQGAAPRPFPGAAS